MSDVTIITNNRPRDLISFHDLPKKEVSNFDYLSEDEKSDYRFVSYKGNFYDINKFMNVSNGDTWKNWDGYQSDTFFSGVLVKFVDLDQVIVGRYYC